MSETTLGAQAVATDRLELECRECGRTYPLAAQHVCEWCFGPLEVRYDAETLAATVSREAIEAGPASLWRYAPLLPVLADVSGGGPQAPAGRANLDAGWTPLVRAPRLGQALGLRDLWIKDDTRNPTGSFKDRVVAVAAQAAAALGFDTIACASTGNLAHAVSAAGARLGIDAVVLIPADLERAKVVSAAVFGGTVAAIRGNYDDVNRLCAEIASENESWAFVNVNVRPFYAEGSKTIGFEIAEQLGWQLPDHVVAPMASGAMLVKIDKAFRELVAFDVVADTPYRVSGAQAEGCSPISTAFKAETDDIRPVRPSTIAKSLAIGNPADGVYALEAVRRTGGAIDDVTDTEIVDAITLLARTEGIFAETAGGVTIATLRKLVTTGRIAPDERTVAVVSGTGLKTLDAVADRVGPAFEIPASLDQFTSAYEAHRQPSGASR